MNTRSHLVQDGTAIGSRAWWAVVAAVLLWMAFPPLGIWPLAFLAVAIWVDLADRRFTWSRRDWLRAWFGSLLFWLAMTCFVTLPHWAGFIGWVAMSAWLSMFLVIYLALARALQRRFGWRLSLACATAWLSMEWLRAHLLGGYGMAMLPHAFYRQPLLIQTADLVGGIGVSWLVVAAVGELVLWVRDRRLASLAICVALVGGTFGYGAWRLGQQPVDPATRCVVGLIQGSRDVRFGLSESAQQAEELIKFREYRDLTTTARKQWPDLQLVIWPEGMFPAIDLFVGSHDEPVDPEILQRVDESKQELRMTFDAAMGRVPLIDDPPDIRLMSRALPLLAGASSIDVAGSLVYNSALLIDRLGAVESRYMKMHLVMFGEYVPLGKWFPAVYRLTPIPTGFEPGVQPQVFSIDGFRFLPSICFESTVAHLIRRQATWPSLEGEPDCLVNVTNDGWFYGSSCLDQHLACNVFRAVELRKPAVVAANTGFSAHIDGSGRILAQGARRQTDVLRAEVVRDGRRSLYWYVGDWPGIVLAAVCLTAALLPSRRRGKL